MFCQKKLVKRTRIVTIFSGARTVPRYYRWTQTAADCYKRGCRCGATDINDECPDLKYCSEPHINFKLKEVVRRMVAELGTDRIESDLQRALEEANADLFL